MAAEAVATDRSAVTILPPSSDPHIAPDLAKMHKARLADAAAQGKNEKPVFVLGSRESRLALIQTEIVKEQLQKAWPGQEIRIVTMKSAGDKDVSQPLYLLGGKALWTKELEVALLDNEIDAIVHSLKDVPTEFPPNCELGAILTREDPSDALCVKEGLPYTSLGQFPDGSVIGTSSVRRVAQLRRKYPKLKFADVRGLVQTRLKKLDDPTSPYTAIILASAGLIRMGLRHRITATVTSPALYHAVGQGALGVEIRSNDPRAAEIVGVLEDWKTGWATRAERAMLRVLEGGCSVPVGCETFLVEESMEHVPFSEDGATCPRIGLGENGVNPHGMGVNGITNGVKCPRPKTEKPLLHDAIHRATAQAQVQTCPVTGITDADGINPHGIGANGISGESGTEKKPILSEAIERATAQAQVQTCPVTGVTDADGINPHGIGANGISSSNITIAKANGVRLTNGVNDAHGFHANGYCSPLRPPTPHDAHSATLTLAGTVTSLAGTSSVLSTITRRIHSIAEAEELGSEVAKELVAGGGRAILEELGRHVKEVGGLEGKELPFESNNAGEWIGRMNIPPIRKDEMPKMPPGQKSPHPDMTVFKEGEVCLRPMGW